MDKLVPWIYPKTIDKLKKLAYRCGRKIEIKRNSLVGSSSKVSYMISGSAMLSYSNAEGKLLGASFIFPGSSIGEFTLLTDSVRLFSIVTLTRSVFFELNISDVKAEMESSIELKKELFDHIIARQYSAMIGLIYNNIYTIRHRLIALLMALVKSNRSDISAKDWGLVPKVSQESIARVINTSRNTVNLLLMELVEEETVLFKDGSIFVKYDPDFIARPSIYFDMNGSIFNTIKK